MHSKWLTLWRITLPLAALLLFWWSVETTAQSIDAQHLFAYTILPPLWLLWWGRKGHFKPMYMAQIVIIFYSIVIMSNLYSPQWYYPLAILLVWLVAFYAAHKHLKQIKQTLIKQFES